MTFFKWSVANLKKNHNIFAMTGQIRLIYRVVHCFWTSLPPLGLSQTSKATKKYQMHCGPLLYPQDQFFAAPLYLRSAILNSEQLDSP